MSTAMRFIQVATYVLVGGALCAAESGTTDVEERLSNIERMLAAQSQVQQAAYPQMMAQTNVPYDTVPYDVAPYEAAEQTPPDEPAPDQVLPYEPMSDQAHSNQVVQVPTAPEQPISEELAFESELLCVCRPQTDHWMLGMGIIPTGSHVAHWPSAGWDASDVNTGVRLNLGYERADGYGFRVNFWGVGSDSDDESLDIDIAAHVVYFDVYKRLTSSHGELVLGVGSLINQLKLEADLNGANSEDRFTGGGIGIFAEGYHPLCVYERTEFGVVGKGRMSLVRGEWRTPADSPENVDTMMLTELGFGLEMRRYFGEYQDQYWHLSVLSESQRWESGDFELGAVGFTGVSFNFGVAW